jgi:hypothetical protein
MTYIYLVNKAYIKLIFLPNAVYVLILLFTWIGGRYDFAKRAIA